MENKNSSGNIPVYNEYHMSQIMICAFHFAPKGFAHCNGQLLPINQNQALFALLGTTYGGNGQTTFALPDLRGRAPMHMGMGHNLGEAGGSTSVTLTGAQLPQHIHPPFNPGIPNPTTASLPAGGPANTTDPAGNYFASEPGTPKRFEGQFDDQMSRISSVTDPVGGGQAHNNMMPYTVLNFVIALQGIFPSQN